MGSGGAASVTANSDADHQEVSIVLNHCHTARVSRMVSLEQ